MPCSWPCYHKLTQKVYQLTTEASKYPLISSSSIFSSVFLEAKYLIFCFTVRLLFYLHVSFFFFNFCFKPAKSGIRDFHIPLTVGLLAQERQQFGLSGLGFLPTAITLDACRWSVGCRNPNPCVGMALCLRAGWAAFHSGVLLVSKHKFCMPSFSWRRFWCDKCYRNSL